MDQIPMDKIHARRTRYLKESEETLDKHVDSRDNKAILKFLASVENIRDRADLFQSAVLKLTCNGDWDTLGAVLKDGETDKENLMKNQWINVGEDKEKTPEDKEKTPEGRTNPIIIASEQASCLLFVYINDIYNSFICVSRTTFSAQNSCTRLATGFPKSGQLRSCQLGHRRGFDQIW